MLTRWNDFGVFPSLGFRDFPRLSRDLDRLLFAVEPRQAAPRVTFEERQDAWILKSELPGFSEKEVDISVTGSTVTLKVERKAEAKGEGDQAQARAATYRFERSFELPTKVDPEKAQAELKLGVLTLTLPKASETMPKQITVKAG
ncbi:MAG TPA: Hsp20/alpha crystallin family protein [Polyangiaceae bacterium]|jgi:HSP20 family protein|nr:Hsp20/alpha crystallin family protein [Polyangiaceae bacterium]